MRSIKPCRKTHRMTGLTYVEVLIATALITVSMIPAIEALRPGVQGMGIHEVQTQWHYELTAKLEELLAKPFAELDAEAVAINAPNIASVNYSDPVAQANRRLVYLSRYDADNADGNGNFFDAGMDEGLLWLRVEIEGSNQAIEALNSVHD